MTKAPKPRPMTPAEANTVNRRMVDLLVQEGRTAKTPTAAVRAPKPKPTGRAAK